MIARHSSVVSQFRSFIWVPGRVFGWYHLAGVSSYTSGTHCALWCSTNNCTTGCKQTKTRSSLTESWAKRLSHRNGGVYLWKAISNMWSSFFKATKKLVERIRALQAWFNFFFSRKRLISNYWDSLCVVFVTVECSVIRDFAVTLRFLSLYTAQDNNVNCKLFRY